MPPIYQALPLLGGRLRNRETHAVAFPQVIQWQLHHATIGKHGRKKAVGNAHFFGRFQSPTADLAGKPLTESSLFSKRISSVLASRQRGSSDW